MIAVLIEWLRRPLRAVNTRLRRASWRRAGIDLAPDTFVHRRALLERRYGGSIRVGARSKIWENVMLLTYGGDIVVGEGCSINAGTVLYGHGGLQIGNNVLIAAYTVFIPASHVFADPAELIAKQGETRKGIRIGDDVWIGTGAKILDGVEVGTGSVIGAGAVVTKSIPPYSIAYGIPAVVRGRRGRAPDR